MKNASWKKDEKWGLRNGDGSEFSFLIERFPKEFCFQITDEEVKILRFQIGTSNDKNITNESRGGRRYLPYVFTEQGIEMLVGVLKNEIAVALSVNIIKLFLKKI